MLTTIAAAALAAQPAPEPAWQPLAQDGWGKYFLDPASVRRDGRIVRFRMRGARATPGADGESYFLAGQELDCGRRTITTTDGEVFRADGSLVTSRRVAVAERVTEPIEAGSAQDSARAQLCGAEAR